MKYDVIIPGWSEGKPLTIPEIEADSPEDAVQQVVAWVNRRAGYSYCSSLPAGTKVRGPDGSGTVWDDGALHYIIAGGTCDDDCQPDAVV